jgi:peroxiredoxin (alkyl hydroperoxide reductase subunit C)
VVSKVIRVGDRIPDFELEAFHNNEIKKIRLSDYRGRWLVLVFYPADFTFICPTEIEEFAESYDEFRNLDAEVISISTDTVYVHKAWYDISPAIRKVRFPMAADPAGKVCRAFGTLIEDEGVSLRATFIIDPDGVVRAIEMHDNSIGRSVKEILRKLKAAKYVREHPGEVCPASWEPGKETLKPSLELVGKI